jgi:hypothetical protein
VDSGVLVPTGSAVAGSVVAAVRVDTSVADSCAVADLLV